MDKMWNAERRMLSTIPNSTGIVEGKTSKGLVLDDEVRKWKVDFREEERANIEKWIRDAIPD
jgi:hypothetical protein